MEIQVQSNSRVLSDFQREEFVSFCDSRIVELSQYLDGLVEIHKSQQNNDQIVSATDKIYDSLYDASIYIIYMYLDLLVLDKHLIQSKLLAEKQFFRGKIRVLLNEGFKKLYGFKPIHHKKSEWHKIQLLADMLPQFKHKIQFITDQLEKYSELYSWWDGERNNEVHLDTNYLYEFRHSPMNENEVVMQTLKLWDIINEIDNLTLSINREILSRPVNRFVSK